MTIHDHNGKKLDNVSNASNATAADMPLAPQSIRAWEHRFAGLDAPSFPAPPNAAYKPKITQQIQHEITGIGWPEEIEDRFVLIAASWITLISWSEQSHDVVLGAAPSSTAPVMPIRALFETQTTVLDLLASISAQFSLHLQAPLTDGDTRQLRALDANIDLAFRFQTMVINRKLQVNDEELASCSLVLGHSISTTGLLVQAAFDPVVTDLSQVKQ